jgi:hypothetical protein
VLPFRIENVLPSKSLEYFLSSQHWLDAFPPPREPHYRSLCEQLAALLAGGRPAAAGALRERTEAVTAFDQGTLRKLERELAGYIGPVARPLVERAARTANDWHTLIAQLAIELDEAHDRAQFTAACQALAPAGS